MAFMISSTLCPLNLNWRRFEISLKYVSFPLPLNTPFTNTPQKINQKIIHPLLSLLGLALHLPDPTILTKSHALSPTTPNTSQLRYMQYDPLPLFDSDFNAGIYVAKHVDFGTFTCSFRQPVAGLQFLDGMRENVGGMDEEEEGAEWKWVKPMREGVLVNAADWLACVTGRWCRSGVHRVHAPPVEQVGVVRHAVNFFSSDPCLQAWIKGLRPD